MASWQPADQRAPTTDADQDDPQSFESGFEGEKKQRFVTTYERDRKLRKQAIAIHGASCKACGFNFGKTYGDFATGFIHVHHVVPVSEFGGQKKVDPVEDLIPLCANCHAVVYLDKSNTLTLEKLKGLLSPGQINLG
ncbi:HNH endonuclease [Chromobacterium piscinae]|uniref:HNH endonuclease n=1 Tax=Chromobacterium piscinae TaxID=686831 RepID=UPI001E58E441|nr:HNH endonuclease [Chromobacterium piscinae]MCD4504179.1 HNH endonuclease [Chromobacterium piscinae]